MGKPRKPSPGLPNEIRSEQTLLLLPPSIKQRLKAHARLRNTSVNEWVLQLVASQLAQEEETNTAA